MIMSLMWGFLALCFICFVFEIPTEVRSFLEDHHQRKLELIRAKAEVKNVEATK